MTDKEAIGVLGYQLNMRNTDVYTPINYEAIETVLSLIQTQQEEINDLKWKNEIYVKSIKSHKSEIEKKDNIVRSIISRLDNDIKNIAETKAKKKSEYHLDDYTRNRLKAYKTKTREIKEYIEKEYFAVEKEKK